MMALVLPLPAFAVGEIEMNPQQSEDTNGASENKQEASIGAPEEDQTQDTGEGEIILPDKRAIGSFTINNPPRITNSAGNYFNLREYAGEKRTGYAVVQGSCTDGTYSYHCLINPRTDWGRIVKVRLEDGMRVAASAPYFFHHGSGMCYDSKRNKVVVASHTNYRRTLTFVDPDNLNNITQKDVVIGTFRARMIGHGTSLGITALGYSDKYDCYIAMQKTDHNVVIYDAETLHAKAVAYTRFDSAASGTFQSVDVDDTYMYFLLSNTNGTGKLVAFDWHAEKLAALMAGKSTEDIWWCGNGDGKYSAIITIKGVDEIESLYHLDVGGGKGHFYLVNYDNDPKYKTVKYKVKWKKVKKKVKVKTRKVKKKVKWKKVKTKSGKTKWKYKTKKVWKYKYKKKKVWKYKTKTKKVVDYYNRDSFIMDLGVF